VNEFNLDELEEDKRNQQFLKDLGFDALALNEISVKLLDDVQKIRDDKKNIEEINNNINSIVVQNTEDFNRLEEQIKNKVAETNNAKTPESKYIFLKESQQLIKKQSDLKQNSKDLLRLSDSINGVLAASAAASSLGEMTVVADKFEQLYKEGKEKEAIAYLVQNRELVAKSMKDESIDLTQNLVDRVVKIDEEITTLNNKIDAYSRELKEVEIAIQSLENTRATAKSKDLAEEIYIAHTNRNKAEVKVEVIDKMINWKKSNSNEIWYNEFKNKVKNYVDEINKNNQASAFDDSDDEETNDKNEITSDKYYQVINDQVYLTQSGLHLYISVEKDYLIDYTEYFRLRKFYEDITQGLVDILSDYRMKELELKQQFISGLE
jgi:hypothetical protein